VISILVLAAYPCDTSLYSLLTGIRCQSEVLQIPLSAGTARSADPWSCTFHSRQPSWTHAWKVGERVWRDDDIAIGWGQMGVS